MMRYHVITNEEIGGWDVIESGVELAVAWGVTLRNAYKITIALNFRDSQIARLHDKIHEDRP